MRVLALLCVGLALAAADVSHLKKGYTYDKPTGAQSYNTGSFNTPRFDSAQEYTSGSGHQATFAQPQQSTGFANQGSYTSGSGNQGQYVQPQQQSGFASQGQYVQPQQQSTGFASQGQYVQPQQQSTGFVSQGFSGQGQYQGGNQADTFSSGSGFSNENRFSGNNYQQRNLEPIVTKNFYVHAAPEERQVVQLRVIQEQARPRKNYNVIFVKTPAGPIFKAPHIQQQVQNEDKTLVYVLSKNQAHAEDIVIPAPAPAIPTKPEVFFIKYKNQHDADHKIQEIQSNYNQGNLNFNPQGLTSAQVDGPQLSSFTTTNTRFGDESSSGSGSGFGSGSAGNFVSQPATSFQTVGSNNGGFGSGSQSGGSFVSQQQPATSFQTVGLTDAGFGSGSSSGGFSSGGSVGHGDSGSSSTGTSQTFTSGGSVGSDNEIEYLPANQHH